MKMKRVLLRDRGTFKAREVITAMLELPLPNQGITYAEMRRRDRVLDVLEASKGDYMDLEDNDYNVLKAILDQFQFATNKRELRRVLDDIANAKAPEEMLHVVKEASGE
jgi:hypothetical protein